MKSGRRGKRTLAVEVGNVSPPGLWLFVWDREVFAPFKDFPWFQDASIRQIANVELPSPNHLYWPALDIDLAVESLDHPERYPLVSRGRTKTWLRPAAASRKVVGGRLASR